MIVKDLLEALAAFPPETRVFVDGYEGGLRDPAIHKIRAGLDVRRLLGIDQAFGPHVDAAPDEEGYLVDEVKQAGEPVEVVDAVLLSRDAVR